MKILIVSKTDCEGGAARAAFRLHKALRSNGFVSSMHVARKLSDDPLVLGPEGRLSKAVALARDKLGSLPLRLQVSSNRIHHSLGLLSSPVASDIRSSDADVVNLHWLGDGMLSIADIGRLTKPLLWTFHDSWAFCGCEHHPDGPRDDRYVVGYTKASRKSEHRGLDLDRWTWMRKATSWKRPMHVATPSHWLGEQVRKSKLMADWPLEVIPNAVSTAMFRPLPKPIGRDLYELPRDVPLILFGAIGGTQVWNKGWDLLVEALRHVHSKCPEVRAVVVGQSEPSKAPDLGMPIHYVGRLRDDAALSVLFTSVDVVVVPSRVENLPQVATEAQACGVPVVAFNCTGMPEVVDHMQTGFLAKPYDARDLAEGLLWVLAVEDRRTSLGGAAREKAVKLWSPDVVAQAYTNAYERCIADARM